MIDGIRTTRIEQPLAESRWALVRSTVAKDIEKVQGLWKPFAFSIIGTFLTAGCGVVSNKIVAVWGGPELSALIAVFRQLYAGFSQGLSFGADVTIVQALSSDKGRSNVSRILAVVVWYLLFAIVVCSLIAVLFSKWIASGLLGSNVGREYNAEIQIVIFSSLVGLALIFITAILNAYALVRQVLLLNVLASFVTAISAYILIVKYSSVGAAILVGSGNLVALFIGVGYVRQAFCGRAMRLNCPLDAVRKFLKSGTILTVLNVVSVGMVLLVQAIVARSYGLHSLGLFTASYTIITTFMMLFMSPMKMYVLPTLGRMTTDREKHDFVNQVIQFTLMVVFPFAVLLLASKGLAIGALYSAQFSEAGRLLSIEILGIVPRALTWILAIYVLSAGLYNSYMIADMVRAGVTVIGCGIVVAVNLPLSFIVWVFMITYITDVVVYLTCSIRKLGFHISMLSKLLVAAMALVMVVLYMCEI